MDQFSENPSPGGWGWLKRIFEFAGVLAFIVMFGSTLLGVIARYFGLGGFEWSFEVAGIAFIWIIFIGLINAEVRGENVAFEAFKHSAPPRLRAAFDAIANLALLTMGLAFVISGWAVWQRSWKVPTSVLRMPTGVITAAILILGVAAVCIALYRLSHRVRPLPEKPQEGSLR
ncbi:TRAP transporter small permease [Agrobacterium vitis]|uniref:TRAP transporter small permease n=1 Tax=Agrobacterium vitis TaxID=373 RepID=UPI000872554C|nr:TRAP transporter small permease [Agrobacterium vitis]MCE6075130.1 TRAP transporter small permease subunit [Agrobacterium vitis]MCM2450540.1 TRAP transporter small permease [Agrobacterium vitis]MCM2467464.1 TRAP transporter small permease [Agrobacterium vitis]MUO68631.1 TRAP transporter small permease subunit [Agrobacterium vitis]MUO84065.1 TRAP transporter small permease subunit [Agrobacterium vitis]